MTAVRTLLRAFQSKDMPTAAARALWIEIALAMLSLADDEITVDQIRDLRRQIGELRKAILAHLVYSQTRGRGTVPSPQRRDLQDRSPSEHDVRG